MGWFQNWLIQWLGDIMGDLGSIQLSSLPPSRHRLLLYGPKTAEALLSTESQQDFQSQREGMVTSCLSLLISKRISPRTMPPPSRFFLMSHWLELNREHRLRA